MRQTFALYKPTVLLVHCDQYATRREVVVETGAGTTWPTACASSLVDMLCALQRFLVKLTRRFGKECAAAFLDLSNPRLKSQQASVFVSQETPIGSITRLLTPTLLAPCRSVVEAFQSQKGEVELECRLGIFSRSEQKFVSGVSRACFFACFEATRSRFSVQKPKWVDTVDWYWGTCRGTATRDSSCSAAPMTYVDKRQVKVVSYELNDPFVLRVSAKTEVAVKRPARKPTAVRIKRRCVFVLNENASRTEIAFTITKSCVQPPCSQWQALQAPCQYEIETELPATEANYRRSSANLVLTETVGAALQVWTAALNPPRPIHIQIQK